MYYMRKPDFDLCNNYSDFLQRTVQQKVCMLENCFFTRNVTNTVVQKHKSKRVKRLKTKGIFYLKDV